MRLKFLITCTVLCFFLTPAFSQKQIIDIHYADFSQNLDSLQLNGDAFFTTDDLGNNVARIVRDTRDISGSMFYKTPVSLLDPNGNGVSFSAFFRFRMHAAGGITDTDGDGADGCVFVVQTVSNNVGSTGNGMGYEGIPNSLGIEFDTYNNGYLDNNNGNHIGIDTEGQINSKKHIEIPERLNDGDIWCVWIDYSGISQVLEIRFDSVNVRPINPIITDTLNLLNILGTNDAYFGFTAATGTGFGNHDILEFRFINEFLPIDKNLINDSIYYVNEEEANGYIVGEISKDLVYDFNHLFLQYPIMDFEVDSFTGIITVKSDSGLDYEKKSIYNFNLIAVAFDTLSVSLIDTIFDTANITIHVNDLSFIKNFIDDQTMTIKDTASALSLVGEIKLKDSTFDTLIFINNNSEFDLDSLSVFVSASAELDYDSISFYTFIVVAKKKDHVDDTALITINIEDVIFTTDLIDDQTFSVYDSINSGGMVGVVSTKFLIDTLLVIDLPQDFKFNVTSLSLFSNDSTDLNADSINQYKFTVVAKKDSYLNDTATITINVLKFIKNENIISDQSFTVKEDILTGHVIGAIDFEVLPDNLILLNSFPEFSYLFMQNQFLLNPNIILEDEIIDKYIYTVIAQKTGYVNDTAIITIYVEDVTYSENFINDQTFDIYEDIPLGSFIGNVDFVNIPDTLIFIIIDSLVTYDFDNNAISSGQKHKFEYDDFKTFSYQVIAQKDGYYNDTAILTFNILEVKIPKVLFSGYYDFDANGKIDSVYIQFTDTFNFPDQVEYNLIWTSHNQDIQIVNGAIKDNNLFIDIKEGDEIKTSGEMKLLIYDPSNGDSLQINVNDKAAPVLSRVIYENGKSDKSMLKVVFSENIEMYSSSSPFNFYRKTDNKLVLYEILISNTKLNGNRMSWISDIDSVTVVDYVFYNDSVNINVESDIVDCEGNLQNNEQNRLVKLEIENNDFEIEVSIITPFTPLKTDVPHKFKELFNNAELKGTIIDVDFKSQIPLEESDLECSIYDVVGNLVAHCGGIDSISKNLKIDRYDNSRKIIVYWSGRNESHRIVASGTYLIILRIKPQIGIVISKKIMAGVSK